MFLRHGKVTLVFALVLILSACGGGGAGSSGTSAATAPSSSANADSSAPVQPDPVKSEPAVANEPPLAPDDAEIQLTDWATYEGVLPGSDPEAGPVTFELNGTLVPFKITDPATGAFRYDPLPRTRSGSVEYRIVDEHGLHDWGRVTFLHALKPAILAGECPFPGATFAEPVANVWTHPDDSVLFIGFGEERIVNVRRFEMIASGDPNVGPALEASNAGAVLGSADELLVDPQDPDVIYARVDSRDLWVSRDAGRSFEAVAEPGYGAEIDDLAVTGGEQPYLWAVNADGIYRARKETLTFAPVHRFDGLLTSSGYSIAVHPDRPERLVVVGPDGTHRTEDAGKTWALVTDAPNDRLRADPHDPDRLYAAESSVYVSRDFGQSWTYTGHFGAGSRAFEPDPFRPGRLYAARGEAYPGLWVSDDEGAEFHRVEALPERVRGLAFSSTGALYVGQGNRLACRALFEVPAFDPDHPLQLSIQVEDRAAGVEIAEAPLGAPLAALLHIENRSGRDLAGAQIGVWLEAPTGRFQVYESSDQVLPSGGFDAEFELPPLSAHGRHRLVASADLPNDAAAGALSWLVGVAEPPPPTEAVDHAVLSSNTLWLNYDHPWFPVVTDPGERRRTVLDVENEGPDIARNVVVRIATGAWLRIDQYGPVRLGQTLDCLESADALTCRLGDMAAGTESSIELYVTPLGQLSAVPVSVSSDTPSWGVPSGGLDLVTELAGPETFADGDALEYQVTLRNLGDEEARSFRIHGAIGPWPVVRKAQLVSFSDPSCKLDALYARDDEPLAYTCSGGFLDPGASRSITIRLAPEAGVAGIHHVVEAVGFPGSLSSYWGEVFRGDNSRGAISTRVP